MVAAFFGQICPWCLGSVFSWFGECFAKVLWMLRFLDCFAHAVLAVEFSWNGGCFAEVLFRCFSIADFGMLRFLV